MAGRPSRSPAIRPNQLSGLGRINPSPRVGTLGLPGSTGDRRPRAQPGRGALLLVLGALAWFVVSTVVELTAPSSDLELGLFFAMVAATALVGGSLARRPRDVVALTVGSVVGLVLSGVLVAVEPGGHDTESIVYVGSLVAVLVVLGTSVVRGARRHLPT